MKVPQPTAARLHGTLGALADASRRRVLNLLRLRPLRSSEIAAALAMTRPRASRHLRVLRQCGLVSLEPATDDARARVYRLQRQPLSELSSWIAEVSPIEPPERVAKTESRGRRKK